MYMIFDPSLCVHVIHYESMAKTERLPEEECVYLRGLSGAARNKRAAALVARGWSLAAIGDAFTPPKTRSTIKSWITSSSSSSSRSRSDSTLVTAERSRPVPHPGADPASAAAYVPRRERRVYNPRVPVISQEEKKKIQELAPIARRYRARANPNGIFARSNDELTAISIDLYTRGVSIRELATTAGVTYRAMARRVGR
jgi:hypothetical protein